VKGPESAEAPADNPPQSQKKKKRKDRGKQSPRGRNALPENLERREQVVMPEDEKCTCGCGEKKSIILSELFEPRYSRKKVRTTI
jgi:hypothetical protein